MALSAACGTFTTGTGTSNIPVTGVGFQPKAVIFFGGPFTAAATGQASMNIAMGWATGTIDRGTVFLNDEDAQGTADVDGSCFNTACYGLRLTDGTGLDGLLDFVSFDADGFTVIPDDAFSADFLVGYLALGGDSLTNVIAGEFTAPTTSGTFDITDAGFQPTSLLLLAPGRGATSFGSNVTPIGFNLGVTDGTASRCIGLHCNNGTPNDNVGAIIRDDSILNVIADGSNTNRYTFDSFLSNGFRLNKQDGTTGHVCLYLALAGASVKVSSTSNQASTGNFSVTGVGFKPAAVLLAGLGGADTFRTSQQGDIQISVGAASSSSARAAVAIFADDLADPSDNATSFSTTRCYLQHNLADPHALAHAWDFVSADTDGYTLNQTDASGATEVAFGIAFGPAASEAGTSVPSTEDILRVEVA